LIVKGLDTDLSEQQVMDCSSDYFGNYGCWGGWRDYAMMYIQAYGLVKESTLPYTATKKTCNTGYGDYKISQWSIIYGCDNFRTAVRRGPIAVGVAASSWADYASGVYECDSRDTIINHSVILAGYTVEGHWIIKNCWGPSWGDSGYITINKDTNNCLICTSEAYGAIVSP
jgi:C1A family cysteine protease